jgi:hypothetical protein
MDHAFFCSASRGSPAWSTNSPSVSRHRVDTRLEPGAYVGVVAHPLGDCDPSPSVMSTNMQRLLQPLAHAIRVPISSIAANDRVVELCVHEIRQRSGVSALDHRQLDLRAFARADRTRKRGCNTLEPLAIVHRLRKNGTSARRTRTSILVSRDPGSAGWTRSPAAVPAVALARRPAARARPPVDSMSHFAAPFGAVRRGLARARRSRVARRVLIPARIEGERPQPRPAVASELTRNWKEPGARQMVQRKPYTD